MLMQQVIKEYNPPMSDRLPDGMKTYAELERKRACYVCKIEKPFTDFGKDRTQAGGISYRCKACAKIEVQKWKSKFPNKQKLKDRIQGLKKNYGITLDEYDSLFRSQNGCCAICKRHQSVLKRSLAVDHDRDTKVIRGLLCDNCNPGIGYFKHSVEMMEAGILYLKKFKN